MQHLEADLQDLVAKGKKQGYLTYKDVTKYLPDESQTPDELNNLVVALGSYGIELTEKAPANSKAGDEPSTDELKKAEAELQSLDLTEKIRRPGEHPALGDPGRGDLLPARCLLPRTHRPHPGPRQGPERRRDHATGCGLIRNRVPVIAGAREAGWPC